MKVIILLLLATSTFAQMTEKQTYAVAGFNAGYSKYVTAGVELGLKTGNVYFSLNQIISLTSNATVPKVFTANAGYNIGSLQPFISYGYQTIGGEREQLFKGTSDEFKNGFRLGGGMKYYFKNFPLSITAQRQGKQNNLSLGIYKTL